MTTACLHKFKDTKNFKDNSIVNVLPLLSFVYCYCENIDSDCIFDVLDILRVCLVRN